MWQLILICIFMAVLAMGKALVQSKYAKKHIFTVFDSTKLVFYSFVIGMVMVLPFAIAKNQFGVETILFGLLAGLFSFGYQFFYTLALKKGPMGLSVLLNSMSMILPVLFSTLFYKEAFTLFRILGTVFILLSFILNTRKDKENRTSFSWFLLAVATFLFHGSISIVFKYFSLSSINHAEQYGIVFFMYVGTIISSLITLLVLKFIHYKKENKIENPSYSPYLLFSKPDKALIFTSLFIAIDMAVYDVFDVYCVSIYDGPVYFPLNQGLTLIFSIAVGMIVYKEKLRPLQVLAVLLAIAAIILLSIPNK